MLSSASAVRVTQSVFARQVGYTVLGQGITLVVSMATAAITARWLGPEGRGQLAILLLVPGMLQLFLGLGIGVANAYYVGSGRVPVPQLTANSMVFALLGTATGALIVLILLVSGTIPVLLPGVSVGYLLLGMIAVPLGLLSGYLQNILQGLRRILTLNILSVAQVILAVPLMAVFIIWLEFGVLGALMTALATQTIVLTATIWRLRREGAIFRPEWNPQVVRTTLTFGLKCFVANVLQFFCYRLDALVVNFFLGPAGVGIYGVSVALAELLWQLPNAVSFVLFPKSANSSHETMNRFTPRIFWITLGFTAMGAAGLASFGRFAIRLIFSSEFLDAYVPLLALLPGVVLLGTAKILTNDIAGRGYPQYNSITSGISLVVTVILDLLLIPTLGVLGASLASSVSYALTFFVSVGFYYAVSRRLTGRLTRQGDSQCVDSTNPRA